MAIGSEVVSCDDIAKKDGRNGASRMCLWKLVNGRVSCDCGIYVLVATRSDVGNDVALLVSKVRITVGKCGLY